MDNNSLVYENCVKLSVSANNMFTTWKYSVTLNQFQDRYQRVITHYNEPIDHGGFSDIIDGLNVPVVNPSKEGFQEFYYRSNSEHFSFAVKPNPTTWTQEDTGDFRHILKKVEEIVCSKTFSTKFII